MVTDWAALAQREADRFAGGTLAAGYAAGLCFLMSGDEAAACEWLGRAAGAWRESYADAPPGSWGRPIGVLKALVLAGDRPGAEDAARWALAEGTGEAESPIGRYAAALACSVLGDWEHARIHSDAIRIRDDFPRDVGDALAMVAAEDVVGYVVAVESVLASFETREAYLEDVPVADTVLVLQALAGRRNMAAELTSDLLP